MGVWNGGENKGRPKGAKSKCTLALEVVLSKYPDYHPVEQLILASQDERASLDQKIKCAAELAQYVCPKLKQIEHSGSVTHKKVKIMRFDNSRDEPSTEDNDSDG